MDEKKDPENCNIFKIYKLIGDQKQCSILEKKYRNGGFGYGHAKSELLELILSKYKLHRLKFQELMGSPKVIEQELESGAKKANQIANSVLKKVKKNIGLM